MEYPFVIWLHVFFGIIWAGGAISGGLFFVPAVLEAGPAGGTVMAGVMRRRFPIAMTVAAIMVVLTGARLYMVRFNPDWMTTPEGLVLTFGGILGVGAFVLGVAVQKPAAERLTALGAQVAASGAPPSQAQIAEISALRAKLARVARLTAWHLIGASLLMASHRLAALI